MSRNLKEYPGVSLKVEEIDGLVDFERVFGRCGSVHIEIGSGKGTFLLQESRCKLKVNFLGIEWANKYYRHSVDRLGRWGVANVRVVRAEAAEFVSEYLASGTVDCFHIYFPDPWPKKRHHKRRFFKMANVEELLRVLKPGGLIKTVTDHGEYFEQIKEVLNGACGRLEKVDFWPPSGAADGELVGTNFERKYLKAGRQSFAIAVRKKQGRD